MYSNIVEALRGPYVEENQTCGNHEEVYANLTIILYTRNVYNVMKQCYPINKGNS